MSVNKVILVGRLGQDPQVRYTASQKAVANFSVATSESWFDKNTNQKQERTEWHRIVVWGKLAELCQRYLKKGRQVYIEGRIQTRQWQDNAGQKRYTTEVNAQTVQFLGDRSTEARPFDQQGTAAVAAGSPAFAADNALSQAARPLGEPMDPQNSTAAAQEPSQMHSTPQSSLSSDAPFKEDDVPF